MPEETIATAVTRRELHPVGTLPALQSLVYIIIVALFLMTFTVQPFRIPSESMEPTLLVGDFLLVDKQEVSSDHPGLLPGATIRRRDVIVFHDPVDPTIHLVKRVIGMPGDRVHLHDGRVWVNGRPLEESYAVYKPSPPDGFRDEFPRMDSADPSIDAQWWARMRTLVKDGELRIPEGEYFVLGDNRNDSEDSRYWGLVPRGMIVGKPVMVYFSLRERALDDDEDDVGTAVARSSARTVAVKSGPGRFFEFARWDRMFKVVR